MMIQIFFKRQQLSQSKEKNQFFFSLLLCRRDRERLEKTAKKRKLDEKKWNGRRLLKGAGG